MRTESRPATKARGIPGVEMLQRRIRVALGKEAGDRLLTGGQVVNVFTGRVEPANVVVADGWIAGVGPYEWRRARPSTCAARPCCRG